MSDVAFAAEVYARECERRGVNYLTPEELAEGDRVEHSYEMAAICWFEAEDALAAGDLTSEGKLNQAYRYWLDEASKLSR